MVCSELSNHCKLASKTSYKALFLWPEQSRKRQVMSRRPNKIVPVSSLVSSETVLVCRMMYIIGEVRFVFLAGRYDQAADNGGAHQY